RSRRWEALHGWWFVESLSNSGCDPPGLHRHSGAPNTSGGLRLCANQPDSGTPVGPRLFRRKSEAVDPVPKKLRGRSSRPQSCIRKVGCACWGEHCHDLPEPVGPGRSHSDRSTCALESGIRLWRTHTSTLWPKRHSAEYRASTWGVSRRKALHSKFRNTLTSGGILDTSRLETKSSCDSQLMVRLWASAISTSRIACSCPGPNWSVVGYHQDFDFDGKGVGVDFERLSLHIHISNID